MGKEIYHSLGDTIGLTSTGKLIPDIKAIYEADEEGRVIGATFPTSSPVENAKIVDLCENGIVCALWQVFPQSFGRN